MYLFIYLICIDLFIYLICIDLFTISLNKKVSNKIKKIKLK